MSKWLILFIVWTGAVQASTLESYWYNHKGIGKYSEKAYFPAYQNFLKALENDPLNPRLQLNLARTFEANEDYEKADKAYRGALKILPENSNLHFEALFNLGNVDAKLQHIDEALAAYQAALEIDPESKEVKTNIELLWQGGGGQGKGDGKDKKDQKEGEGKGDQSQQPQEPQEQKKKPKPFQSQELSKEDVKRILDEIKNQEQSIRANDYEHGAKDAPRAKDW